MARRRRPILSRVVEHYHRTFCEREDAQAYLAKRGLTDRDLLRALKVGYADGSLLKVIPKDGEVREQLVEPGRHHARGPRAPGRLCGRADPGSAQRPVDEPLRPGDEDAAALLPSRPSSRRPELPGGAALARGRPHRIHPRCAVLPPGRHLDRDPDLRHERLHAGPPRPAEARGREACGPRARQRRRGEEGNGRIEGEAGGGGHHGRVPLSFPEGIKDANELLVSRNGDAGQVFRQLLDAAVADRPSRRPLPSPSRRPPLRRAEQDPRAALQLVRDGRHVPAPASTRCSSAACGPR